MQLDLFEQFGNSGTIYQSSYTEEIEAQAQVRGGKTIVSKAHHRIMQQNPFAFVFRGKTLEEIEAIHKSKSGYYFKRSNTPQGAHRLSEWYSAMFAGQAIALEEAYRAVDARFIETQNGEFYLEDKKGIKTLVRFEFSPNYFGTENSTTVPTPHLEFRTDVPTEISETGYRSHFLQYIPYQEVNDFNDFLIKILRHHLKVKSNVIFENKEYGFGEELKVDSANWEIKLFCDECGEENLELSEECPSCGMNLVEEDFETEYFEEFEEEAEMGEEIAVYATV